MTKKLIAWLCITALITAFAAVMGVISTDITARAILMAGVIGNTIMGAVLILQQLHTRFEEQRNELIDQLLERG